MGYCPTTQDLHMKAWFLKGLNQELLLAPSSNLRHFLSNKPFCFEITLFYKHCNYPIVYLTTFLLFSPIKTFKISQFNSFLPLFHNIHLNPSQETGENS